MEILTGAFSLEISPYKAQNGLKTGIIFDFNQFEAIYQFLTNLKQYIIKIKNPKNFFLGFLLL